MVSNASYAVDYGLPNINHFGKLYLQWCRQLCFNMCMFFCAVIFIALILEIGSLASHLTVVTTSSIELHRTPVLQKITLEELTTFLFTSFTKDRTTICLNHEDHVCPRVPDRRCSWTATTSTSRWDGDYWSSCYSGSAPVYRSRGWKEGEGSSACELGDSILVIPFVDKYNDIWQPSWYMTSPRHMVQPM